MDLKRAFLKAFNKDALGHTAVLLFGEIEKGFVEFLSQKHADELKCEFYLPFAVCDMLNKGECDVKVYRSEDSWYGVTYKNDKAFVMESIEALKKSGAYPDSVAK
jgi:hypothetical protein